MTKLCKYCNKPLDEEWRTFCNKSCAASYRNIGNKYNLGRRWLMSEESRKRVSDSKKGRSNGHEGFVYSEESRRKISNSMKGNTNTVEAMKKGYTPFQNKEEHTVKDVLERNGFIHQYTFIYERGDGGAQKKNFRLDFYHPLYKVNVELDGRSHNADKASLRDSLRDEILMDNGVIIHRFLIEGFSNSDLISQMENLIFWGY